MELTVKTNYKTLLVLWRTPLLLVLFAISSLIATGTLLAAPAKLQLAPVLPLQEEDLKLHGWHDILKDDALEVNIESDLVASEVQDDIRHLQQSLSKTPSKDGAGKKVKGATAKSRQPKLRKLYRLLAAFNSYLRDVSAGRVKSRTFGRKAPILLKKTQRELYKAVSDYVALKPNKREIAIAAYHAQTTRYLSGHHKEAINDIKANLTELPQKLRLKALLLVSYHQALKVNAAVIADLSKAAAILDRNSRNAAHMLLAQHYARRKSQQYRDHIFTGLTLNNRLPRTEQLNQLHFGIKIWRQAEPQSPWLNGPFPAERYSGTPAFKALRERDIITQLGRGKFPEALERYRQLADEVKGSSYMVAIDQRIIATMAALYRKSDQVAPYEAEIRRLVAKYRNPKLANKNTASLVIKAEKSFSERYYKLTFKRLDRAASPKATTPFYQEAIKLGYRYIKWTNNSAHQIKATEQIAAIFVLKRQHAKAVAVFDSLLASGPKKNHHNYLVAAIKSQSIIASWPLSAPMLNSPKDKTTSRKKLLGYYLAYQKLTAKLDWNVLGQIGLLQINQDQRKLAYQGWRMGLQKDGKPRQARQAAAMMLISYDNAKMWQDLEEVTDICLDNKIAPSGLNVKHLSHYLASALYFGGKEHFAANRSRPAWQKFKRFNQTFNRDPRRDETLFLIAFAYKADNLHVASIESLVSHSKEYPKSPYRTKNLLSGITWATDMALEEMAIYFGQTFVNENPKHKMAHSITNSLIDIYLAMGFYGDAGRLYKHLVVAEELPSAERISAALKQMTLEEKFGSRKEGEWGASYALQLTKSPSVVIQVLAFRARGIVHSGKDIKSRLIPLIKQAETLDLSQSLTQEYLGQMRYFLAETTKVTEPEEIFNLGISDHNAALDLHYSKFLQARKDFDRVCASGETSFCAPALKRISEMTAIFIKTLEQIEIPSSLDAPTVNRFNERKDQITKYLAQIAIQTSQRAYELTNQGMTAPEFAYGIIWENTNDWNFGQSTNDVGYAFSQWQAKPKSGGKAIQVIQHAGESNNVLSPLSHSQWVKMRKSNDEALSMYGTLGANAYEFAIKEARTALLKSPKDFDALVVLANGLVLSGNYQLAAYYADMIETLNPNTAIAPNIRGLAILHSPKIGIVEYQNAAALFARGIEIAPTEVAAALNLGYLYLELGNAEAARRAFEAANTRCQSCSKSLLGLGTALVRTGKYSQARTIFHKVLNDRSVAQEAHYRLALVAINGDKDFGEARRHLEIILESQNTKHLDLKRRANVLLRRIDARISH